MVELKANLLALYQQVPEDVRLAGLRWYHEVRGWCYQQAEQFGLSPWQVAAVVAALSPRLPWSKNQQRARLVLLVWAGGGTWKDILLLPGIKRSLTNAWRVLSGQSEKALNGPKTAAFADNLAFQESTAITVDVWAVRAAMAWWDAPTKVISKEVSKRYSEYAQAYAEAATEIGIRGYEFQAILWVWVRYCVASKVTPLQLTLL